ncbi:NADase-type glycan-binding domain-containing protein [Streptomyces sp. NPDC013181]|uniref:NADase-type glycan-binding domain-containing protein n=1 Tax=Streptomyces sp. NPDC013181 TaxID=3364864 RepID=UPI00367B16EB
MRGPERRTRGVPDGTPPPTPSTPARPEGAAPRRPGDRPDSPPPGPAGRTPDTAPQAPPANPAANTAPVVCPGCGAENAPGRTLCVRCALLLNPGPPPAVRPPWWRRIISRRRPRRGHEAGARPRRRRRAPRLGVPLALLLVLAAVWFALPHLSGLLGLAKEETGAPESMPPTACHGSSAAKGHAAGAAFDGFNNRYWAPEETGDAAGEFLECEFDTPVRMLKMVVFPGTSARTDEFLTQARPARLVAELTAKDGTTKTKTIRLKDQAGQQTFDVRGSQTVRVRLTVDSAYGTGKGRRVAVAEVEFFGHRS